MKNKRIRKTDSFEEFAYINYKGEEDTYKIYFETTLLQSGEKVIRREELASSQGIAVYVKTKLSSIQKQEFQRKIMRERDVVFFSYIGFYK